MPRRARPRTRNIKLCPKIPAQWSTSRPTNRLHRGSPIIIQTLQRLCKVDISRRSNSATLLVVERRVLVSELIRIHISIRSHRSGIEAECGGKLRVLRRLHWGAEHVHQIPTIEGLSLHTIKGLSLRCHAG